MSRTLVAAGCLAAFLVVGVRSAVALTPPRAAELGMQAYAYGYPLMEFLRVRSTMTSVSCRGQEGNAPVNTFSHTPRFARPQDRTVVAPNVDTLYSIAHLDLGEGPVVLEHPDMGDRYFMFQFLDPYTNTLGFVGSRTTGSAAGRFALTWSGGPQQPVPGAQTITVAHRRIWVIARTIATDDPADQRVANALMRQYTLSPPGGPLDIPECETPPTTEASYPSGLGFLDALSTAMEENPPPARDAGFLERLKPIGVGPGLRVADAGLGRVNRAAAAAGVRSAVGLLEKGAETMQLSSALRYRGWAFPDSDIGDYGTDYLLRAGVAYIGLGANTEDEAAYRTAFLDSRLRRFHGRHDYRLRFRAGEEPPAGAFWSVTVYDDEGFLVDTPSGRHAVGDTHPPLHRRADGSVEIYFSQRQPEDPDVNWLPVPDARFRVYLRIYVPAPAALTRDWRPPAIVRVR